MGLVPFPFEYVTRAPARPLGRFVESIWYARGTVPYRRERIAPTGSTVAVFVLGDAIVETPDDGEGPAFHAARGFLLGPHDRPVVNAPTGETHAVGIVGTPVGCEAVFGVRPATLRGRVVDLETAWPPATAIREALLAATSPEDKLDHLEERLASTHASGVPGLDRVEAALADLEADPTRPIARVAADQGVSHGHLDRLVTRVVGLTPRVLARSLRLRRLLAELDVRGRVDWADLAAELGWYDQAHLVRDFKRHTGVTPTAYLAAQRAVFTSERDGDAAGFVPEA